MASSEAGRVGAGEETGTGEGDVGCARGEGEEVGSSACADKSGGSTLTVGYLFTEKKRASFLRESFLAQARAQGISFRPLDKEIPLSQQGPFDVVLHKNAPAAFLDKLEAFCEEHPETLVLDRPGNVRRVFNRASMLDCMDGCASLGGQIGVPRQRLVSPGERAVDAAAAAGLVPPLIAKPLIGAGTRNMSGQHEMVLVYDQAGLEELDAQRLGSGAGAGTGTGAGVELRGASSSPSESYVLQEFVNHAGVLYKVYVLGDYANVAVLRPSLSDIVPGEGSGLWPFARISNHGLNGARARKEDRASLAGRVTHQSALKDISVQNMLGCDVVESICAHLRRNLGLNLFNVDLIRCSATGRVLVVDINYFPGFSKMPEYESLFTGFLVDLVSSCPATPHAVSSDRQAARKAAVTAAARGNAAQEATTPTKARSRISGKPPQLNLPVPAATPGMVTSPRSSPRRA